MKRILFVTACIIYAGCSTLTKNQIKLHPEKYAETVRQVYPTDTTSRVRTEVVQLTDSVGRKAAEDLINQLNVSYGDYNTLLDSLKKIPGCDSLIDWNAIQAISYENERLKNALHKTLQKPDSMLVITKTYTIVDGKESAALKGQISQLLKVNVNLVGRSKWLGYGTIGFFILLLLIIVYIYAKISKK